MATMATMDSQSFKQNGIKWLHFDSKSIYIKWLHFDSIWQCESRTHPRHCHECILSNAMCTMRTPSPSPKTQTWLKIIPTKKEIDGEKLTATSSPKHGRRTSSTAGFPATTGEKICKNDQKCAVQPLAMAWCFARFAHLECSSKCHGSQATITITVFSLGRRSIVTSCWSSLSNDTHRLTI